MVLFGAGFLIGKDSVDPVELVTGAINTETPSSTPADFSDFWEVWNIINERYYEPNNVDPQEKVWGAISGLVASLDDPYSVFLPPEETEFFNDMIAGSFGGVGMEIGQQEGAIVVVSPLKGTPAERAGIRSGDVIIKIDEESTLDLSVDEAVNRIRGDVGTKVALTISREGEDEFLEMTITRERIDIPTLDTELRPDGIFVLSLYNFDGQSSEKVHRALKEFVASGSTKLIFDLRGNPGGILGSAVEIASYFLPEGEVVVSEKFEQGRENRDYRSFGYKLVPEDTEVVVLVDRGSASASEIVAGALQEHGRAVLVGETTYGKGSVQELISVANNTSVKITIGKWYTPNGLSISDGGLTPDVEVLRSVEDFQNDVDPQLDAAVDILLSE
ncbi:MAG: peptidase S41 [Candidatus Campbellbacteria bacterium]